MGSQPTIEVVELYLEEFCEACLELVTGQAARGSILADVLPSFARTLQGCGRASEPVFRELDAWKQKSQQLARLARLHCGSDSKSLIESLEQISREGIRVLDALKQLTSTQSDVVPLVDDQDWIPPLSDAMERDKGVDQPLQQFCEGVLVLLHAGPGESSVLSQTMPSLYLMFSACRSVALAQLRAELNVSRTTAEQLLQFADAHCQDAVAGLEERINQAQDCAERLISSMTSLAAAASEAVRKPARQNASLSRDDIAIEGQASLASTANDVHRSEAQKFYDLAIQSHQRQDFPTAETLYSEALRLDGALRMAWLQRGRIRLLNSNAPLAIADLTRTIRLFDADPLAYRWRGDALTICGRLDDALKDYDRSLEINSESTIVRYNRAVVLRMLGQLDAAWSEFEQLLQLRTNRPGAHLNRGLICLARKETETAIREFQAALAVQPDLPEAIERLTELGVPIENPAPKRRGKSSAEVPIQEGDSPSVESRRSKMSTRRRSHRRSGEVPIASKTVTNADKETTSPPAETFDDLALAVLSDPGADQVLDVPAPVTDEEIALSGSKTGSKASIPIPASGGSSPTNSVMGSAADTAAAMANRSPSQTDPAQTAQTNIEVRCPGCQGMNIIRWERLQPGKAMSCRRCKCNFAVQADGTLVQMVKNRRGQWSVVRDRLTIWKDKRVLAAIASVAVVLMFLVFRPESDSNVIPEGPDFPQELEPRAKMFTLAWLKGDFRTMRQLTDSIQSHELHLWAMDNPAPVVASLATLERDANLNVEIVNANHPNALLQVRIDGLRIERGQPVSGLPQNWRQDGDRWIFQPVARSNL